MIKRNSLFTLASALVVILVTIIAWLLISNPTPAVPQPLPEDIFIPTIPAATEMVWPTPPQPDFTAFAQVCCPDNGTPGVLTPSKDQIDLWTQVAITQKASFSVNVPTLTPIQPVVYLEPSGKWQQFTDEKAGYSFEYPDNWFTVPENVGKQKGVAVLNSSPDQVNIKGSETSNPNKIKIVIFQSGEMGTHKTLQEYAADPAVASVSQYASYLKSEISPHGYQVLWQKEALTEDFLIAYISDGSKVFRISAPASSKYVSAVDHIVDSFNISGSTQGSGANPSLVAEYSPPVSQNLIYFDAQYGFSFKYPANWFITQTSTDAVSLTNFSLSQVEKSTDSPLRFRVDLYVGKTLGDWPDLASYVNAHIDPNGYSSVISQHSEVLENGNTAIWQELELQNTNRKITTVYVSDGEAIYELYGPSPDSSYISVLHVVVETLVFP